MWAGETMRIRHTAGPLKGQIEDIEKSAAENLIMTGHGELVKEKPPEVESTAKRTRSKGVAAAGESKPRKKPKE